MKRTKYLLFVLLFVCVFVLSGCVRMELNITVKANGKVDISYLAAIYQMDLGEMGGSGDEEMNGIDGSEWEKDGFQVEPYEQDNYKGILVTGTDLDPSKFASEDSALSSLSDSTILRREGDTFIFDYPLGDSEDSLEALEYASYFEQYGGFMRISLTTPIAATNHNATTVSEDGKTLTWDLAKMKGDETFHAEFKLSVINWIIIGCVIAAVVAIVAVVVIILVLKKKKKSVVIEMVPAEAAPVEPIATEATQTESTQAE